MQDSVIYQQIKLEGKEERIVSGKLAVAKNLLNMGMSVEQVAQATELSVEQILHLQTNNHQNNS